MTAEQHITSSLTSKGKLRASINLGNSILASLDPGTGSPKGVSVDLAKSLASRLGVEVELVVYTSAEKSVAAVAGGAADIGFFAIDPVRGEGVSFTTPYILIEGGYLVQSGSSITTVADVDQAGNLVVVSKGSAYDLFLTRELRRATLNRSASPSTVVETFKDLGASVAAGIKPLLQDAAARSKDLRVLDGRFMVIEQAMVVGKSQGPLVIEYMVRFVEEMKSNGFIASALARHAIRGATVAPRK